MGNTLSARRISVLVAVKDQQGITLLITMILLVVITLSVLTSMRGAILEERMAGNQRDRSIAFQAAETTLRYAGTTLVGVSIWSFDSSCTSGLCSMNSAPDFHSYDWVGGTKHLVVDKGSATSSTSTLSSKLAANPAYSVEHAGMIKCPKCSGGWGPVYRVTARAQGINSTTSSYAQSVYRQQ